MRGKLSLKLEDLSVDSFDTSVSRKENGTVYGEQQCTCPSACTCPGCPTCDASCNGTCDNTCPYSCDDATCVTCEETRQTECYYFSLKYTNCNYACY